MTTANDTQLCSITACPQTAVDRDQDDVGPWLVTIFYCAEHARERDEGTPLGPVGVEVTRVRVEPLGSAEPATGSTLPGIA